MLVGLVGNSRTGKDEIANILVKDFNFEKRNLANPIREILLEINPPLIWVDDEGIISQKPLRSAVVEWGWDEVKRRFPWSVDAMIALGQSGRDLIDKDIWLNACVSKPFTDLVIADVRQVNEAEFILANGGELWKVERKNSQVRGMDGILDGWDFTATVDNNGTMEELEKMVGSILEGRR